MFWWSRTTDETRYTCVFVAVQTRERRDKISRRDLRGAFPTPVFRVWMASTSKLQIYRRPLKADEIVSRGRARLGPPPYDGKCYLFNFLFQRHPTPSQANRVLFSPPFDGTGVNIFPPIPPYSLHLLRWCRQPLTTIEGALGIFCEIVAED